MVSVISCYITHHPKLSGLKQPPIYYFKWLCGWTEAQLNSSFLAPLGIAHRAASDGDWGWNILDGSLACLAPSWGQLTGWAHLGCWDGWDSLSPCSLRAPPSLYGFSSRIIGFLTWWLRAPQWAAAFLGLSPDLAQYHLCHILLVRASHRPRPCSRERKVWLTGDHPCNQPLHLSE